MAIKDKVANVVYETTDYTKFKLIVGNRHVSEERKQKIRNSIKRVGYIPSPILCNEALGIVDGQARYSICKEDGYPVYYTVVHGIGIEECISMNTDTKNWGHIDFITSYADLGNLNYARLLRFLQKNAKYPFSLKIWTVFFTDASNKTKNIKDGSLIVTDQMIDKAQELMDYFGNFSKIKTNRPKEFFAAIAFCYNSPEVDNNRLVKKLEDSHAFEKIANSLMAIEKIEAEYNSYIRKGEHVYIKTLYLKHFESKGITENLFNASRGGKVNELI